MNNKHLTFGTTLRFKKYYPKDTRARFAPIEGTKQYALIPCVEDDSYSGDLVGIRSLIMEDYKLELASTDWETGMKDGSNYATGKRENVYLVCFSLYKNPVIVRKCDIIP